MMRAALDSLSTLFKRRAASPPTVPVPPRPLPRPPAEPPDTLDQDLELELEIDQLRRRILAEPDRDRRLALWAEFVQLIKQRSPAQIARMERAQGLR